MIHGFFRLKDRTDRRPGFPVEPRLTHFVRRFRDVRSLARKWFTLFAGDGGALAANAPPQ